MARRFAPILALLAVSLPLLASAAPVAAKATVISDDASCTAAGGKVTAPKQCSFPSLGVATGDTLTINGEMWVKLSNLAVYALNVEKGATLTINGNSELDMQGYGYNGGTINLDGSTFRIYGEALGIGWMTNDGTIAVKGFMQQELELFNRGIVSVACSGYIQERAGFYGNPPRYECPNAGNLGTVRPLPLESPDPPDR